MTKAAIAYFTNSPPQKNDHYRSQWEYWKRMCTWSDLVDKLYIVDVNNHGFTDEDHKWLSSHFKEYEIFRTTGITWDNDNIFLYRIDEDLIMRIDDDAFVYRREFVEDCFNRLESENDFVSSFRVVGQQEGTTNKFILKYWEKFPYLREQGLYEMGEWFWFIRRDLLHQCHNLDFAPSMVSSISTPVPFGTYIPELDYVVDPDMVYEHGGLAGALILSKSKNPFVFPTDTTICLINNPSEIHDKNFGWFHIGNRREAFRFMQDPDDKEFIDNPDRVYIFRPLGYFWIMDEAIGWLPKWKNTFLKLAAIKGYTEEDWMTYIQRIKVCHPWMI